MDSKIWYTSKTLWVNVVAVAAGFLATRFGIQLGADEQVAILGVINIILRFFTTSPVTVTTP